MANKIQIKDIKQALSTTNSSVLLKIYKEFKKHYPKEMIFTGTYDSKYEILKEVETRMIETIQEEYTDIKSQISQIRKTGQDIELVDLEILEVPLKIKLLESQFSIKNQEKIFSIIKSVKKKLKTFKLPED